MAHAVLHTHTDRKRESGQVVSTMNDFHGNILKWCRYFSSIISTTTGGQYDVSAVWYQCGAFNNCFFFVRRIQLLQHLIWQQNPIKCHISTQLSFWNQLYFVEWCKDGGIMPTFVNVTHYIHDVRIETFVLSVLFSCVYCVVFCFCCCCCCCIFFYYPYSLFSPFLDYIETATITTVACLNMWHI